MKITEKDLILAVFGSLVVSLFSYLAYQRSNDTAQPRYEGEAATAGLSGILTVFEHLNTGDHYFHPGYCAQGQGVTLTAHRYPTVSGGNITALIHNGISAMSRPAPQDNDWLESPPSNEAW